MRTDDAFSFSLVGVLNDDSKNTTQYNSNLESKKFPTTAPEFCPNSIGVTRKLTVLRSFASISTLVLGAFSFRRAQRGNVRELTRSTRALVRANTATRDKSASIATKHFKKLVMGLRKKSKFVEQ